jgi:hypothetical protein
MLMIALEFCSIHCGRKRPTGVPKPPRPVDTRH